MDLLTKSLRKRLRELISATDNLLPTLRIPAQLSAIILRHGVSKTVDWNFLSHTSIEPHRIEPAWIKRLERKRKLLHILQREIVILGNTRGAFLCEQSVRKRLSQCVHTP